LTAQRLPELMIAGDLAESEVARLSMSATRDDARAPASKRRALPAGRR
jgi:hypothetical protein